ncbi:hypothetical protein UT300005_06920 [Clostridium sp. CTA-5]
MYTTFYLNNDNILNKIESLFMFIGGVVGNNKYNRIIHTPIKVVLSI